MLRQIFCFENTQNNFIFRSSISIEVLPRILSLSFEITKCTLIWCAYETRQNHDTSQFAYNRGITVTNTNRFIFHEKRQ